MRLMRGRRVGGAQGAPAPAHPAGPLSDKLTAALDGGAVVVLSGCGWSCSGGGQRPVQLAREFARMGRSVVYFGTPSPGESRVADGVFVVGNALATLRAHVAAMAGIGPGVILCCQETYTPEALAMRAGGWAVLYDLIDDWPGFIAAGDLPAAWHDEERERRLVGEADAVVCTAPRLVTRAYELGASRPRLVPNGGSAEPVARQETPPEGMLMEPGVRAAFSGYLFGSWIDFGLLDALSGSGRVATTLVGATGTVKSHGALAYVGGKPWPEALHYLAWGEAGIVPFRGPLCLSVDPVKYYDHLACGLWTVATPEVEPLHGRPYVITAQRGEWPDAIEEAARKSERPTPEVVRENSWRARAEAIAALFPKPAPKWEPAVPNPVVIETLPDRVVVPGTHALRATWEVPASCNMHPPCPYCSNLHSRSKRPALPGPMAPMLANLLRRAEEHGPLYISLVYGEPCSDPETIWAIGQLGRRHQVDVVTNLVFDLEDIVEWPRTGNIRLCTSFHPHHWRDLEEFVAKRQAVIDSGIYCGLVEIVGYPPSIPQIPRWCESLRAQGISPHVMPFNGTYQGQAYPAAYTPEERALVWGEVESHYGVCLTGTNPKGTMCAAGRDYVFIAWDGEVRRCYAWGAPTLGTLQDGFTLQDGPEPCFASVCDCPDLWRYRQ